MLACRLALIMWAGTHGCPPCRGTSSEFASCRLTQGHRAWASRRRAALGGAAWRRTARDHVEQHVAAGPCVPDSAVAVEQRDPTMGPNARLDIVEYPSDAVSAASYDVSGVTS